MCVESNKIRTHINQHYDRLGHNLVIFMGNIQCHKISIINQKYCSVARIQGECINFQGRAIHEASNVDTLSLTWNPVKLS